MKRFALVEADGRARSGVTCLTLAEAEAVLVAVVAPGTVREMPLETTGATHWWTGTEWAARPAPPAPPALVAGVAATWAGLPVGAVVTVTDPATGVVAGTGEADASGDLALTLPAGPWRITVNEAFPAVAASFDIEVATE